MVSASFNHPSVFFHAFYNEGPSSDPKACAGYNASAAAIRARGTQKLVTWASDKKTSDKCLDIADVVSFNSCKQARGGKKEKEKKKKEKRKKKKRKKKKEGREGRRGEWR